MADRSDRVTSAHCSDGHMQLDVRGRIVDMQAITGIIGVGAIKRQSEDPERQLYDEARVSDTTTVLSKEIISAIILDRKCFLALQPLTHP